MSRWIYDVDLRYAWKHEETTFTERRDEIVSIIRASSWARGNEVLAELLDDLGMASSAADFDQVWDEIYDLADTERAWIRLR